MKVAKEAYARHHCTEDAIESAVQQTLSIKGVRCGVLIAERESTSEIKLSFRSKGEFLVNEIAASFGGGGHIYAAGARIKDATLDEAVERVLGAVSKAFDALDARA
jgi:phosphoesterase RecJ-like protein